MVENAEGATYRLQPPCEWIDRINTSVSLAICLGVWLLVFLVGVLALLGGLTGGGSGVGVALLLLVVWSIAGALLFYFVARRFRLAEPETLVLARRKLLYDSGSLPMCHSAAKQAFYYGNPNEVFFRSWGKRVRIEIEKGELGVMSLERDNMQQHLTIQRGDQRIEIGPFLRWAEREWLAEQIQAWQSEVSPGVSRIQFGQGD